MNTKFLNALAQGLLFNGGYLSRPIDPVTAVENEARVTPAQTPRSDTAPCKPVLRPSVSCC